MRYVQRPVRLFFALPLPPAARDELAALATALDERAPDAGVGWVPAENMHLTLRFLDEVADDVVPALHEAAREAAAGAPRFRVSLEGVGTFGGRQPRVIWVGLKDDAGKTALVSLAAALERKVRATGFAPADHAFSAHATLGRIRGERGPRKPAPRAKGKPKGLDALVDAVAKTRFGPLEVAVDRFVLYESRLHGSRHPEYVETASFALA